MLKCSVMHAVPLECFGWQHTGILPLSVAALGILSKRGRRAYMKNGWRRPKASHIAHIVATLSNYGLLASRCSTLLLYS